MGQMARALADGMVAAGYCRSEQIVAFDPSPEARERFTAVLPSAAVQASNCHAVEQAETVVLAVKPHQLRAVGEEIRAALSGKQLVVSIAAGVSIAQLSQWMDTRRIVRVMPNTSCLVGQGVSAFAPGPEATEADVKAVEQMMGSVGLALHVDDKDLDSVTGLSGSGPAYVYLLIEALADGGVRVGLSRETALALAAHTVRGAAEMVIVEQQHPAVLKDRVTSPGGTTIAGLQVLEERGVRAAAIAAVEAATGRSRELGQS
jgi:pyrroline-5-carboxylate reductase